MSRRAKGRTLWGCGAFAASLLAMLAATPVSAGASQLAQAGNLGKPGFATLRPSRIQPPGTRSYQVAVTATWNVPVGTKVSFQPVEFNCTDGPVFTGSFTTTSEPFANVIPLMTADQGFPCLLEFTRGWWRVTVTRPGKGPTEVDFVDQQVGPLTYLPGCTAGLPACVGVPRPLVPLSSVVFSY